jgi:GTP cyclohydrolase I
MKDASSLAYALHPAKAPSEVSDLDIEIAFRTILGWLGEDPAKDGLRDTPSRLRRAFKEYFSGYWGGPGSNFTQWPLTGRRSP